MTLILVLGDIHIPQRAADIPAKFRKLLVPGKIDKILCTGNLTDSATLEYLRGISAELHVVRGEYDADKTLPTALRVPPDGTGNPDALRVGLASGHALVPAAGDVDALAAAARQLDVDVLVTGGTHRFEAYEEQGRFFVNPGSITGAFSPGEPQPIPSFVLMETRAARALVAY
ncbi:Vacuolar protein sorting-associated protein 29, partial [Coemansia sp. RSA 2708]